MNSRTEKSRRGLITTVLALSASVLVFGFFVFGIISTRPSNHETIKRADGIVVLTGGQARIAAAGELLSQKHAKRLLISGVNKNTNDADLLLLSGLQKQTFNCCVDVGYQARNTVGNAHETRQWVKKHDFKKVIVVTSAYHMPRSMIELGRVIPDVELIPYSVMPNSLHANRWWLHRNTLKVLLSEYLKFLPSAARYAASRVFRGWGPPASSDSAHAEL